ncbi:MAG: pantetheine-phosphate adenylyltransferase [Deltaproteobacteria bacterium]|nr:pantetheine-phosphate adenylyltransferase [Deltaproteobacteria bacterium]MBW2342109.1 pantetheine-phosphate adenylyltransferase [Deltaproteobacteria bacterium]
MKNVAIYPGSFDPITNGHLSILRRALTIFDSVTIAVAANPMKNTLFTLEERMDMVRESTKNDKKVFVDSFHGLLVDYVKRKETNVILRGMRALSDFEYEFQMSLMNRRLRRNIQTIFMMTDYKWLYTSSTIIKEAASYGGTIKGLVPDIVCQKLKEKYGYNS